MISSRSPFFGIGAILNMYIESPQMHVLCVCVHVLYGLEEECKEKSDASRPLLGDNVPTSEREFWDIFGGSKLQNRGQYSVTIIGIAVPVYGIM